MLNNKSLRFKLTLFILSGVSLIFVGIFSYYYHVSSTLLLKTARENSEHLTNEIVNKVENVFLSTAKIPENLAYVLQNSTMEAQNLINFQRIVVEKNREIYGSTIAFEKGEFKPDIDRFAPYFYRNGDTVAYQNLDSEAYNYFLQDWYQIPKEINKPYWSEPYFDEGGGNILMTTYSVPFYNSETQKFRGIITIDISLEWLQDIFSELKIYQSGYGFLITKSGRFVVAPNPDLIMNSSIFDVAELRNDSLLRETGRQMQQGKKGMVELTDPLSERKCWLYYAPFPSSGYSMGIIIPQHEFYAELFKLNRTVIISAFIGLGFLFGVISLISTRITQPLHNLSEITKDIGSGNFDVELPHMITGDEIGMLSRSFEKMQITLKEYIDNLQKATAEKERIQGELRIAHDIQMSIIPKTFPPFPHRKDVDIFGILEPAKAVGGDLYDFFLLDDDHLCVAIGDVSGKGVPASLFMAVTRTLLRAKANATMNMKIHEIVTSMNQDLCSENDTAMFVTFFLAIINLKNGKMQYCNAGHNFPYVIHTDGKVELLDKSHGLPLGVMDMNPYKSDKIQLDKGARLFLYTDGINEAENENHDLFDDFRLAEMMKKLKDEKKPEAIINSVYDEVKKFVGNAEQSDDMTMMTVIYKGK